MNEQRHLGNGTVSVSLRNTLSVPAMEKSVPATKPAHSRALKICKNPKFNSKVVKFFDSAPLRHKGELFSYRRRPVLPRLVLLLAAT